MPFINFTNPFIILLGLILFILVLYLGKETKKTWIIGIMLFVFLGILVGHVTEFSNLDRANEELYKTVTLSIGMDLIFVFLAFISYLWIDHIAIEKNKKKSINDNLEWFWKKV